MNKKDLWLRIVDYDFDDVVPVQKVAIADHPVVPVVRGVVVMTKNRYSISTGIWNI